MNDGVFDCAIVGAGPMGSAAAHHLSASMPELLLIGAAEPNDPGTHRGVFGSHYDESRIVRCLDPDGFWSSVAIRSLERAEQLQKKTAIRFLHRVGHLILTVDSPYAAKYAADVDRVGEQNRIDYQLLDADTIAQRFPFLATARAWQGRYERGNAGWLNPREQIRAQISAAVANGATVVEDTVERIVSSASPLEIETCGGARYRSHQVLVAAGVFSNGDGLLPVDLDLFFCGRTVLLLELHPEDLEGLRDMPTIIFRGQTQRRSAYIVPPVRYSDGRWFLKMGGITPDEQPLRSVEEIKRWFRRPGSQEVAELLMATAREILPGLPVVRWTTETCVNSYTPSHRPYIERCSDTDVYVLTGGNGSAGKSADELGYRAARMLCDAARRARGSNVEEPGTCDDG